MKKALVTGVTGQDGSYLAEFLLEKGYEVYGMVRRLSAPNYWRIEHILSDIHIVNGDLLDSRSLIALLRKIEPHEVYNLAAQSHVGLSFQQPLLTQKITGEGAVRLLDAVYLVNPKIKFYQASSSEMFGIVGGRIPQNEETPFRPNNPYAAAKLYAHNMVGVYHRSYGMFAVGGILYNHESPRRGEKFVTRKVAYGAAALALGIKNSPRLSENGEPMVKDGKLELGNLSAIRDWGFAGDYVKAMWLMLQQDTPQDFVIATGRGHTIKDLCEAAFSHVDLNWKDYVIVNPDFIRPSETGPLIGDPARAKQHLDWEPKTSFEELISMMVDAELASLR